jgi:NADH-quinone oxidoreductase subunit J
VIAQIVLGALCALAVGGALIVVFAREVARLALGLATVLLAAAGIFLWYGAVFLAVAQVFVYVGGVLVLLLFALMLLRRDETGRVVVTSRHDAAAAVLAAAVFAVIGIGYSGLAAAATRPGAPVERVAGLLLGGDTALFEALALLLVAALIAGIAIVGPMSRRDRAAAPPAAPAAREPANAIAASDEVGPP